MNAVETLALAREMACLDSRVNRELLDFFGDILHCEAKLMDEGELDSLDIAVDVMGVLSYLHERTFGKKSIFASKILKEAHAMICTLSDDEMVQNTYMFSLGLLEDEQIITDRAKITSKASAVDFIDELVGGDDDAE